DRVRRPHARRDGLRRRGLHERRYPLMSRFLFFSQEALRALRRSAAPSVAAIVTIVVTVLLLGVLIPVLQTTQGKTQAVREQIQLKVFLFDDATKAESDALGKKLQQLPHVSNVQYVSKSQALKILRTRLKDKNILNELNSNPLPASFNVKPDDPDNLEKVRTEIEPPSANGQGKPISPIIEQVKDPRDEAGKIRAVTGAIKIVLTGTTLLVLAASLGLV